tara:strand:+ start:34 stop:483 length:450 start_codon:yes stop_codon:yes gene_type:complete
MSKIKSFRGKIGNGEMQTISLHTNDGSIGYKIVKMDLIATIGNNMECCLKVYSISQTSATVDIDFSDNTLLAAGNYTSDTSSEHYAINESIVFDNVTFNQDIHITAKGQSSMDVELNYYIELEQVKLDLNRNTVATLKDIKNIEQRSQI